MNTKKLKRIILVILGIALILLGYGGYCLWVWFGWGFPYWKTVSMIFVVLVILGVIAFSKVKEV